MIAWPVRKASLKRSANDEVVLQSLWARFSMAWGSHSWIFLILLMFFDEKTLAGDSNPTSLKRQ